MHGNKPGRRQRDGIIRSPKASIHHARPLIPEGGDGCHKLCVGLERFRQTWDDGDERMLIRGTPPRSREVHIAPPVIGGGEGSDLGCVGENPD